jgi:glucodextranase-like protein
MVGRVFRFLVARGSETLLAIGLVLAFFLVCMGILSFAFPRGTSLVDLLRSGTVAEQEVRRTGPEIHTERETPGDGGDPMVALLSSVSRDVKDKAPDAIAWTSSVEGTRLGNHHAVQTFENSGATITFSETSELTLKENTLVILKSAQPLTSGNRKLASLIVVDGELRGAIAASPEAGVGVEIVAGAQSAKIRTSAGPGEPVEFAVRVNEDASSTFIVFKGMGEVSSQKGTLVVAPNHSVTVDSSGSLGAPREIPPPPELVEPQNGVRLASRASRSRIHFAWRGAGENDAYLLAVARDPGFHDIVTSESVPKPEFILGNLQAGTYYWRVSTRRGDLEGPSTHAWEVRIARDLREPDLRVDFPARVVSAPEIVLGGSAEPGTRVFVNNEEVQVSASGRFSHVLTLKRGVNMVVVEAIDSAGNVAYRSEAIDARY